MNLTIGQIAAATGGELHLKGTDTSRKVMGVILDSRKIMEDGVFIATPGERVDGHSFIGQVFEKGAILVITEKTPEEVAEEHGIDPAKWGSYVLVENSFVALKRIGAFYRSTLSIPVVGITGSVGKTSTKEFIARVLSEKAKVLWTEGNYNNEIGVPLTLLRITPETEIAVVEMGISDFGEMTRLSEMVVPDIMVITNIGQCHLENLGDRTGVLKAKTECFANMNPEGEIVLCGDDDMLTTVREVGNKRIHFYGIERGDGKDVWIDNLTPKGLLGTDAVLHLSENEEVDVRIAVPGRHMVGNAAAAALVGRLLGMNACEIAKGIEGLTAIGGRNQIVTLNGVTLLDDCYNANPASVKSSLELLCMADGERIAILGDMFELGADRELLHAQVGRVAANMPLKTLYCVGALSRNMYEAALDEVTRNGADMRVAYYEQRDEIVEAIRNGDEKLPAGSSVLIKASHGMNFPEIGKAIREAYSFE